MTSGGVNSVPESLLRQSVSTTVWSAVGEKHFRRGKQRKQGGKETCVAASLNNYQIILFLDCKKHPSLHVESSFFKFFWTQFFSFSVEKSLKTQKDK